MMKQIEAVRNELVSDNCNVHNYSLFKVRDALLGLGTILEENLEE